MPQGNRGFIGIKKEVKWKTRVDGVNDVYLPFVSEGLTRDIEDVISAIQRGILDEPKSYQGEKAFGGPLVVEVHPLSIGHIFRSALGAPSDGGFADFTETEICDCETEWDSVDTTITSLDSVDKKKGSYSSKIQVTKGHVTTNVIASAVIVERDLVGPPAVTQYKFWLKCDKVTADGNLKFRISEDELGGATGTHDDVDIPAMLVAGVWTEHTINIVNIAEMDKAISIALIMEDEMDEFAVRIDDVKVVVAGEATKAYKHIFTPMQTLAEEFGAGQKDTPLWPYTLEVFRDESNKSYQFLGCVVNTLGLSFSITDKILKANLGIIAGNAGYVDPKTGNSLEATNPFVWSDAKIYLGLKATTLVEDDRYNDLESFTLNWDNKCVAKYALNNTATPRKIIRTGYREIPVSFTVDFTDKTEYDLFLAGTERQMIIKFEGAVITGDAASTKFSLQFDIPLLRYLAWPIGISGPGRISVAVTGKAKYSSTYALLVTLIDDQPHTIYAG